jgi:hypothetical protein
MKKVTPFLIVVIFSFFSTELSSQIFDIPRDQGDCYSNTQYVNHSSNDYFVIVARDLSSNNWSSRYIRDGVTKTRYVALRYFSKKLPFIFGEAGGGRKYFESIFGDMSTTSFANVGIGGSFNFLKEWKWQRDWQIGKKVTVKPLILFDAAFVVQYLMDEDRLQYGEIVQSEKKWRFLGQGSVQTGFVFTFPNKSDLTILYGVHFLDLPFVYPDHLPIGMGFGLEYIFPYKKKEEKKFAPRA